MTFDPNGSVSFPNDYTIPGYTIAGWTRRNAKGNDKFEGADGITPIKSLTNVSGNRKYIANWKQNHYTVSLPRHLISFQPSTDIFVYNSDYRFDLESGFKIDGDITYTYTNRDGVSKTEQISNDEKDHFVFKIPDAKVNDSFQGEITINADVYYPLKIEVNDLVPFVIKQREYNESTNIVFNIDGKEQDTYTFSAGINNEIEITVIGDYRKNGEPTSEIGNNYDIWFHFELSKNSSEINYKILNPDILAIYGEGVIAAPTKITNAIFSQETHLDNYCSDGSGSIILNISTKGLTPPYYTLSFANAPNLTSKGEIQNNQIELNISSNMLSDNYEGIIKFFADKEFSIAISDDFPITVAIEIPHRVILQLYKNVIFVNNHDSLYTGYQWYQRNNNEWQILNNEKRQYLYQKVLSSEYYADLTTKNGTIKSCPFSLGITEKQLSPTVTPYPNPAKAGVPFNLKLIGGVPENASIMIFNNYGALVKRIDNVTENTTITLPRGYYSGALIYDGQKSGFKIIVE